MEREAAILLWSTSENSGPSWLPTRCIAILKPYGGAVTGGTAEEYGTEALFCRIGSAVSAGGAGADRCSLYRLWLDCQRLPPGRHRDWAGWNHHGVGAALSGADSCSVSAEWYPDGFHGSPASGRVVSGRDPVLPDQAEASHFRPPDGYGAHPGPRSGLHNPGGISGRIGSGMCRV